MGILLDDKYWSRVTNIIYQLRPVTGTPIDRDTAVKMLEVACKAFTDLVKDKELSSDLERCTSIALDARKNIPSLPEEFEEFIRNFEIVEKETLIYSGVDLEAATAICEELSELVRQEPLPENFEALPDKIKVVQKLVCKHYNDPGYRNDNPDPIFFDNLRDGVIGVAAVGIDCVAVTYTGPALGLLIGQSVGVGLIKFRKIWKRIW